jgi:hypothetical protein
MGDEIRTRASLSGEDDRAEFVVSIVASWERPADGTVAQVLKITVIVLLVVLVVLLGIPLGMPMSGASMCPECGPAATWGATCAALLGSIVLLVPRRAMGVLTVRARRPLLVANGPLERPPRPC